MMDNAKMGAAVLGGYMLGRTKKAKVALGLGALLAGSQVKPGQLGRTLARSPFVSGINEQVRKELLSAGKAAATSVITAKAEHLADSLHDRTAGLQEKAKPAKGGHSAGGTASKKAPAAAHSSGHRASSASRGGTTASAHRTSGSSGASGSTRETHEEETHGKARDRSSDDAHRTRRSGDG
ncbi:ABC transporter substrate-binding protein [Streptomyces syringium]|uniref:ABC transporter substrate-binding protein n=1 Tax=Streptomyces syringium TaxID=76729 RepID=UPI003D8C37D6